MKIAIFASGNGSNFEAIANHKFHNIEVSILICDNPNAYCLERSKKLNIPSKIFVYRDYQNKSDYENAIIQVLKDYEIDVIVLAGYLRIIGKDLLDAFPNKIINIHPSLLPAFKGLNAIRKAYDYKVKIIGITIHYVNEDLDGGEIIAQECFRIDNKSFEEVESEIHNLEHYLFPKVLEGLFNRSHNENINNW